MQEQSLRPGLRDVAQPALCRTARNEDARPGAPASSCGATGSCSGRRAIETVEPFEDANARARPVPPVWSDCMNQCETGAGIGS